MPPCLHGFDTLFLVQINIAIQHFLHFLPNIVQRNIGRPYLHSGGALQFTTIDC